VYCAGSYRCGWVGFFGASVRLWPWAQRCAVFGRRIAESVVPAAPATGGGFASPPALPGERGRGGGVGPRNRVFSGRCIGGGTRRNRITCGGAGSGRSAAWRPSVTGDQLQCPSSRWGRGDQPSRWKIIPAWGIRGLAAQAGWIWPCRRSPCCAGRPRCRVAPPPANWSRWTTTNSARGSTLAQRCRG